MNGLCDVDLGSLEKLVMGDNALLGDNSTSRMTRSEYPYYFNSTLMMRSGSGWREVMVRSAIAAFVDRSVEQSGVLRFSESGE